MKYYKLTDTENRTMDTQWGEGVTHKAIGKGNEMCSSDVIHVYDHPLKAVMLNPIHANFDEYHLWEVRVKKVVANDGLKVGVKECTTVKQIEAPVITTNQRVRFAIFCALEGYCEENFRKWADNWLSGKDRTARTAWATTRAARTATEAPRATTRAARAAAEAAWAVEVAEWVATEVVAEWAAAEVAAEATRAARAAAEVAWAAVEAVREATKVAEWTAAEVSTGAPRAVEAMEWVVALVSKEVDFVRLIKKAIREEE